MDAWMGGGIDRWEEGQKINGRTDEWIDKRKDRQINGWREIQTD